MYGSSETPAATAGGERTAFRRAEKLYKLNKTLPHKSRKKHTYRNEDLSAVIDFQSVLESFEHGRATPPGIFKHECRGFNQPVFCFEERPGFYFIPGALTDEEQGHWIRESLVSFPQPPNRTNHTAAYGPIFDLFDAVQNNHVLVELGMASSEVEPTPDDDKSNLNSQMYSFSQHVMITNNDDSCKSIGASVILRKLRWSTLGLQFDWSKRNYDVSLPHKKIPDALCLVAKKMAVPAMPKDEVFRPEAAIVNYFGPSDMLGGHLDDMEKDWSKPIVSISLGCKAIFLLGGKSREDMPIAMFLRSGDIVLMAGEARECFHGVPRIFTDSEHADNQAILSHFSSESDICFREYIKTSRININIRQKRAVRVLRALYSTPGNVPAIPACDPMLVEPILLVAIIFILSTRSPLLERAPRSSWPARIPSSPATSSAGYMRSPMLQAELVPQHASSGPAHSSCCYHPSMVRCSSTSSDRAAVRKFDPLL